MTIAQYLRLLKDQWIAVLLLTVLGAVGAGVFSLIQTPQYQADTQLFVSTSGQSGSLGELTQGSTFTQQRVKSYTDLLTSPRVLQPVITSLDLDITPEGLRERVDATSPLDTVLLNVTVTDESPTRAADIANAIAAQFPELVNELETRQGLAVSPVKVSVTRPAIAAELPVSPRTTLNLALGLLVGLGLGVGTAVLRDSLDRTISGRGQAGEIAGAPVLGAVVDDPQASQAPLISHDAFSPRAEAFRQLRTNIRFLSVDHRVTSLVVTGSVPSEGKTTTAANVAIALAQSGERVVLIDADLRRPTVADVFGVPSGVGLTTVLLGDVAVDTALQRWRDDLSLYLLPAGPLPPNPSELIGSARMASLVQELTGHGMTVVVDSPPLLPVTDAAILARVTDGALIVTRVASTKVEQFTSAIEALRTAGAPILGVVLNRVPKRGRGAGTYGGYYARYDSYAPDRPVTSEPAGAPHDGSVQPSSVAASSVAASSAAASSAAARPGRTAHGRRAVGRRPHGSSVADPGAAAPLDAVEHPVAGATLLSPIPPSRREAATPTTAQIPLSGTLGPATWGRPTLVDLREPAGAGPGGGGPVGGPYRVNGGHAPVNGDPVYGGFANGGHVNGGHVNGGHVNGGHVNGGNGNPHPTLSRALDSVYGPATPSEQRLANGPRGRRSAGPPDSKG